MTQVTINYSLKLPTVGGDDMIWATYTNENWVSVDSLFKANADSIATAFNDIGLKHPKIFVLSSDDLVGSLGQYVQWNFTTGLAAADNGDGVNLTLANVPKRTFLGNNTTVATAPTPIAATGLWSIALNGVANRSYGASQNDLALLSGAGNQDHSFFHLSSSGGAIDITGIVPPVDSNLGGYLLFLVNTGANTITLKNSSASSSFANRFLLTADYVMQQNYTAILLYDVGSANWRMFAKTP